MIQRALQEKILIAFVVVLSLLVIKEGRESVALKAQRPIQPRELFKKVSQSQVKLQVLDVRADVEKFYEDIHIPGAVPYPNCDPEMVSKAVGERIFFYSPTVIVSEDGNLDVFQHCRTQFANVVNLEGGMTAWSDEGLPEDSGEYVPPKAGAGGGCL